jgi:hypothetical protein
MGCFQARRRVTSGRNYRVENNNGGWKYLKQNSGSGTALAVLVLMLITTSIARTPYLQFVRSGSKTSEQEVKAVMPA